MSKPSDQKPPKDDLAAKVQAAQAQNAKFTDMEKEVADLTAQLQKMTDLAGRAQADLQNAKVRMQRDREELGTFAMESILKKLLPMVDNFQRAFQHLPTELQDHEWIKGVSAIEQNLMRIMGEMGLRKIEALGQQVDTAKHEVLTIGPGTEGEIIEVFEEGYELNGKTLRPTKVKVGDGSQA